MQQTEAPPSLEPLPSRRGRWRWLIHLALLTAYPLVLGIVGAIHHGDNTQPMLPSNIKTLLQLLAGEVAIFGFVFGIALLVSRPSREDLFLHWTGGWRPIASGLVFSIVLRIGLMAVMLGVGIVASLLGTKGQQWARQLRPDVEQVVSARELVENPAYFVLSLTLVSFVLGGLREELWRAGMFAGFRRTLPQSLSEPAIRWTTLTVSALVFGIGHLPQGLGGVLLTATLGLGLGMILLRKQSIWPAAFAHGFFDAATFLFLYAMVKFPGLKGI